MLKISSTKSAKCRKGVVEVGCDSRARQNRGELDGSGINNVEVDGGEVKDNKVEKKDRKKTLKNLSKSKKTIRLDFLPLELD